MTSSVSFFRFRNSKKEKNSDIYPELKNYRTAAPSSSDLKNLEFNPVKNE
jgi:hypothetical protein